MKTVGIKLRLFYTLILIFLYTASILSVFLTHTAYELHHLITHTMHLHHNHHHTFGFFRTGTEYTFFIDKGNRFFFAPGTFVDFTSEGQIVSLMIVLGVTW